MPSKPVSHTSDGAVCISYSDLTSSPLALEPSIEKAFGSDPKSLGIIVVHDLPPAYVNYRERLLKLAYKFAKLDESVREKYTDASSRYSFGWSHGKEIMNGKPDFLKGSFYANPTVDAPSVSEEHRKAYPEYYGANIWPKSEEPGVEGFEEAFKELGQFVFKIGCKLAAACQPFALKQLSDASVSLPDLISTSQTTKARLLHYFPPPAGAPLVPAEDEAVDSWCGFHLDHSLLTGLCSAMYLQETDTGKEPSVVSSPSPSSGLYIRTRGGDLTKVTIPADCLAFQTGEALEIATGGKLRATPHCVRVGSSPGVGRVSRETFALFMQPNTDEQLSEITFGQFSKRVFDEHYQENTADQGSILVLECPMSSNRCTTAEDNVAGRVQLRADSARRFDIALLFSSLMAKTMLLSALLVAASCFFSVEAISKVSRTGRYLYTDDGNRFYIKGVAYQAQGAVVASSDNSFLEPSSFIDPLADGSGCSRDLPFLQQLNVNTVRVYSVNSSLNHDACMKAFSDAGIYTIIDLALPLNGSIDRTSPSWSTNILDQYIGTINTFNKYDNVLAYNVGNEVIVQDGTGVSPYIKAAARDIRAYLNSQSSSALVGYAAIDGPSGFRDAIASYLSCDPSNSNSGSTSIDIFGLNNYEWCGESSFEASYAGVESEFEAYNVAAYFSEFGCITSPPRVWTEVGALFSSQMSDVWSGGVAFSYFPASSAQGQFGMVNISSDGSSVTLLDNGDFDRLKAQYGNVSAPNSPSKSSASGSYPSCPAQSSSFAASNSLPPTPNEAACNCLEQSLGCQFAPKTTNYSAIVGELINTACGLLGQAGASCDDIGGNGTTGTYGRLSGCDPTIKLSFTMNQYYQLNKMNPESCSFGGNGSVNPLGASGTAAAGSAETSCVSSSAATFTPTSPGSSSGSGSSGSSNTGGSNSSGQNGAVPLIGDHNVLMGMLASGVIIVASGLWTMS